MGEEHNAGSIIVALRAQIENLQKGMAQAKATVENFAKGVQAAATGVQRAGQQMGQTFSDMDKKSVAAAARFGRFTQRLLQFHLAMSSMAEAARRDMGQMRTAIEAVSIGFGAFAAVTSVLPGRLGIVMGIVAALTLVISKLAATSEDTIKALEAMAKTATEMSRKFKDMDKEAAIRRRVNGLFGIPPAEVAKDEFEATKKEIEDLLKFIEIEVPNRLNDLDTQMRGVKGGDKQVLGRLMSMFGVSDAEAVKAAIQKEIDAVENAQQAAIARLATAERNLPAKQVSAQTEGTRAAVQKINATLENTTKVSEMQLMLGLVDPLRLAEIEARAAEKALNDLIEQAVEFERRTGKPAVELGTAISAAKDRAEKARQRANDTKEVDRMARNFSGAIGQGVIDGILAGQSAMETLANVGRNLFENALRDVVSGFETLMTDAFKAITGIAGVELGGLITGLVGVLGAVFSNRKKAEQTFGNIKSNIESTELSRGIVAGPTSVAIAQVSEDLARAMAPVTDRLDVVIDVLARIANNTRPRPGGGGAAGDVPAVAVATP